MRIHGHSLEGLQENRHPAFRNVTQASLPVVWFPPEDRDLACHRESHVSLEG
jgi:hypothetical protein